jgi:hypothetical protein
MCRREYPLHPCAFQKSYPRVAVMQSDQIGGAIDKYIGWFDVLMNYVAIAVPARVRRFRRPGLGLRVCGLLPTPAASGLPTLVGDNPLTVCPRR